MTYCITNGHHDYPEHKVDFRVIWNQKAETSESYSLTLIVTSLQGHFTFLCLAVFHHFIQFLRE